MYTYGWCRIHPLTARQSRINFNKPQLKLHVYRIYKQKFHDKTNDAAEGDIKHLLEIYQLPENQSLFRSEKLISSVYLIFLLG